MVLKAEKLGDVVAQACLSVVRMSRAVEKAHNSKTAEALLVRQCLEKASADAIDSVKDEIQGAHTPADIWRVEKKISAHVSHERTKAYSALAEHHDSVSDDLTGKGRSSSGSYEIAEAEEDFRKSISTLVSTIITEGAKVPGERGAVLTSSILHLVPTTSEPSANTDHRSTTREGVQDYSRRCLVERSCESEHCEFPPQFTFNRGSKCPHSGWEIHH